VAELSWPGSSAAAPWIGTPHQWPKHHRDHLFAQPAGAAGSTRDGPQRSAAPPLNWMIECQIPGACSVADWFGGWTFEAAYQIEASPELGLLQIGPLDTSPPTTWKRHGTLLPTTARSSVVCDIAAKAASHRRRIDLLAHAASLDRADWVTAGRRQTVLPAVFNCLIGR